MDTTADAQSAEASAHNCLNYKGCGSLVAQLMVDQRGATSSVATTHTLNAQVVFGGPSTGVTSPHQRSNPSTAVATLDRLYNIFTSPSSYKRPDEGVRPEPWTLDEPSPVTSDGPTSATVGGNWTIIDVSRVQGGFAHQHPATCTTLFATQDLPHMHALEPLTAVAQCYRSHPSALHTGHTEVIHAFKPVRDTSCMPCAPFNSCT